MVLIPSGSTITTDNAGAVAATISVGCVRVRVRRCDLLIVRMCVRRSCSGGGTLRARGRALQGYSEVPRAPTHKHARMLRESERDRRLLPPSRSVSPNERTQRRTRGPLQQRARRLRKRNALDTANERHPINAGQNQPQPSVSAPLRASIKYEYEN